MTLSRIVRLGVTSSVLLAIACADHDDLPNANPPQLHDIEGASEMIQTAAKAIVKVQHPAGSSGTGAFISPDGLLLTNNHLLGTEACAREGCAIEISFQHQRGVLSLSPRKLFAVPQHVDVGLDMAALQVFMDQTQTERLPTPYYLTFETRSANELVGQSLFAVGHPLGRLKKWSAGTVIEADGDWFESSIFTLPGGSGSPILNDGGKIVGLLHRGAEGFDLLTKTSTQVTAIATASDALERELGELLPSSVISVADNLTRESALAHVDVFLGASKSTANVDGVSVSLIALLADACDKALATADTSSSDDPQGEVASCFKALEFIECRSDMKEESSAKQCPEAERDAWRARLRAINARQRASNGSLDFTAISYSMEALADSSSEGQRLGRESLLAALDEKKPALDFSLTYYLAAYGIDTYNNQSTRDFLLNYASVPFYERYAWQISMSALWLYTADVLERAPTLNIVKALYKSDKVTLGSKLRIEDVLYSSDEL